jgi:hypothetical protein
LRLKSEEDIMSDYILSCCSTADGDQEFFDKIAEKWSKGQPAYKKISKVVLRDTEFEKNSTKKIIRYKKQDS